MAVFTLLQITMLSLHTLLLSSLLLPSCAFQVGSSNNKNNNGKTMTWTTNPSPLLPPQKQKDISLFVSTVPGDDDRNGVMFPPFFPVATHFQGFSDDLIPILLPEDNSNINEDSSSSISIINQDTEQNSMLESVLSSYLGPRVVLAAIAAIYATNFPLGAIMNDALPASAATSARMFLAALTLSPFLFQIQPKLRIPAVLCGLATSVGYISQSIALCDTDPSKVSFLGAATVLWCPLLEWIVDKRPMGIKDAPQTWLAALLCIMGVGFLELFDPNASAVAFSGVGTGDALALLQAVGFGTGVFLSARMVQQEPDQVLPITSVIVATTAFLSMIWCFMDGWMLQPGADLITLPNLFFTPELHPVAMAVLWTGIVSTSLNFVVEIAALGRVPASEASVLLASEPLWAALLAATVFHQSTLGVNDYLGGACIISACLVNAVLKPSHFQKWFGIEAAAIPTQSMTPSMDVTSSGPMIRTSTARDTPGNAAVAKFTSATMAKANRQKV